MRIEVEHYGRGGGAVERMGRALLDYLERKYTTGQIGTDAYVAALDRGATKRQAEMAAAKAQIEALERRERWRAERAAAERT